MVNSKMCRQLSTLMHSDIEYLDLTNKKWTSSGATYHPNYINDYKNDNAVLIIVIVSPKFSYSVAGSDPVFRCSCVNWHFWWHLLGPRRAVRHMTLFRWHYKYNCDKKNEYRVVNYPILYMVYSQWTWYQISNAILLYLCLVIEYVKYNN